MPCFARELPDGRTALPGGARGMPVPSHSLLIWGTGRYRSHRGGARAPAGGRSGSPGGQRAGGVAGVVVGGHFYL